MSSPRFAIATLVVPTTLLLGATCGPTASMESSTLRLVLEAPVGGPSPAFVQVASDADQPGWVTLTGEDGARVYIRPRCDIADCGKAPAVCGAAIPVVRDIASGSIEVEWDGMTSVVNPAAACETRQPAPPGSYVATFCYAREAALMGDGDPKKGVQGTLVQPTCAKVPFTWPGAETVRYRVPIDG